MINNKLFIACAGAGKTTHLIRTALESKDKKILITTFTDENSESIKNKIIKYNKSIPNNITVQPWFSFLLEHCIKPFQGKILKNDINGLVLVQGRSGERYRKGNIPVYWPESNLLKHYFSNDMSIYSDKIAKFAIKINNENNNLPLRRLKSLYNYVFIDEIQDMAGYDFEIIENMMRFGINILMVGDPRQSTFKTHYDGKYRKYSGFEMKNFFVDHCKNLCEVDEDTLNVTHRCNVEIINLADKIFPSLSPSSSDLSTVGILNGIYFISSSELLALKQLINFVVIRYNKKFYSGEIETFNIGKSKGLEFDYTALFLTKDMIKWFFRSISLNGKTQSDLYIALTRAKYACVIVVDNIDNYKDNLVKININNLNIYKLLS